MNIGIQTWGSNGDIRPLLALSEELQKAGHLVTLVVSSIETAAMRIFVNGWLFAIDKYRPTSILICLALHKKLSE